MYIRIEYIYYPRDRIRTNDRSITIKLLQSTALPTELLKVNFIFFT
jgi:hypothetical protein